MKTQTTHYDFTDKAMGILAGLAFIAMAGILAMAVFTTPVEISEDFTDSGVGCIENCLDSEDQAQAQHRE